MSRWDPFGTAGREADLSLPGEPIERSGARLIDADRVSHESAIQPIGEGGDNVLATSEMERAAGAPTLQRPLPISGGKTTEQSNRRPPAHSSPRVRGPSGPLEREGAPQKAGLFSGSAFFLLAAIGAGAFLLWKRR